MPIPENQSGMNGDLSLVRKDLYRKLHTDLHTGSSHPEGKAMLS